MKNLKFWSLLIAFVFGLSFGFTSCGDDDADGAVSGKIDDTAIADGQSFYRGYADGATAAEKALAMTSPTVKLITNKKDKAYVTNFLTGVAMEKYGVSDKKDVTEEQIKSVEGLVSLFGDGFQTTDLISILEQLPQYLEK